MTCNKVNFGTESQADEYLKKLKKTSTRGVVPERSYLCTECLVWHLTSKKSTQKIMGQKINHLEKKITRLNKQNKGLQDKIVEYKKKIQKLKAEYYEGKIGESD